MVVLKSLLISLVAASFAAADGLDARAKAVGKKYFGTAISGTIMNDASANKIAANPEDFGQYTCENEMKFDATEPSRGSFSYANADKIVAQATANKMVMRCHALVWHSQVPSWVSNGGFNNATLISIMQNHIANVVGHYKGQCYAWDVVNEAINDSNGGYRTESVWYQTIGPAFIPIAFKATAAADPAAKLYYNDYNIDQPGTKSTAVQNLVRSIKSYGATIHGVGLQGHFTAGQVGNGQSLVQNLNAFAALGVEVAYTELDIKATGSGQFAQQATDYATITNACKSVSACVGITIWGVTDKYSWISSGYPLPWDSNYQKKAAYNAILNAWGTSTGGSTSTSTTKPATSTTTSTRVSITASSTTTTATTTVPTSGPCAGLYGQCGGVEWQGPTCCSQGTCKFSNSWYSQCL